MEYFTLSHSWLFFIACQLLNVNLVQMANMHLEYMHSLYRFFLSLYGQRFSAPCSLILLPGLT